jgi:hypothetical protein
VGLLIVGTVELYCLNGKCCDLNSSVKHCVMLNVMKIPSAVLWLLYVHRLTYVMI